MPELDYMNLLLSIQFLTHHQRLSVSITDQTDSTRIRSVHGNDETKKLRIMSTPNDMTKPRGPSCNDETKNLRITSTPNDETKLMGPSCNDENKTYVIPSANDVTKLLGYF